MRSLTFLAYLTTWPQMTFDLMINKWGFPCCIYDPTLVEIHQSIRKLEPNINPFSQQQTDNNSGQSDPYVSFLLRQATQKGLILTYFSHFLVTREKTQIFLQHIPHLHTYTYFAHSPVKIRKNMASPRTNCNRNETTCMHFDIVSKTISKKFTKINEVEQCLISINSKWPTFLPIFAYISSSETRRSLILMSTPMF